MVISYNQNLHFRIHCTNFRNKIIIHFIIFWYYIKFIAKVCASLYYWEHKSKYNRIPCLKKKKSKQLKFVIYQNKIFGFVLQVTTTFPTLPKTMSDLFFPEPPLWVGPKFPHRDSKPKEFQIQINKVPWSIPILNACSSKNM